MEKYQKYTRVYALLSTLLLGVFLFGCSETSEKITDIQSFFYTYGSYFEGYKTYTISMDGGTPSLNFTNQHQPEKNLQVLLTTQDLLDLENIINQSGINGWKDFYEADNSILDGFSFKLEMNTNTGTFNAYGYEKYPKNFKEAQEKLLDFLDKLVKRNQTAS